MTDEIQGEPTRTPNEQLAAKVVDALLTEGLLPSEKKDYVQAKISGGTMRLDDWNLIAENMVQRELENGTQKEN